MDLGRMAAGMRSDFLCCTTHQSWVRGVRPRSTPGGHRQPLLPPPPWARPSVPSWATWALESRSRVGAAWQPGFLPCANRSLPLPTLHSEGSRAHSSPDQPPRRQARLWEAQRPHLGVPSVAGMPVVRGGPTVPSQAALCFDPGSPASDRTEGKKKGRPKAENQALRDIPVSSPKAGVGLLLGSACEDLALSLLACRAASTKLSQPASRGRSML